MSKLEILKIYTTQSGCKDDGIRKFEFVSIDQFLSKLTLLCSVYL